MKDITRGNGAGPRVAETFQEIELITGTAAGNDRSLDAIGHGINGVEIVAFGSAVAIHRIEQYFASTQFDRPIGPLDGVGTDVGLAVMREHLWLAVNNAVVDAGDNGLAAEAFRSFGYGFRLVQQHGVQRDLVGAVLNALADIVLISNAAAERQGDVALDGDQIDEFKERTNRLISVIGAIVVKRHFLVADIDHDQFVDVPLNHSADMVDRVADKLMQREVLAPHHPAFFQEQGWYQTALVHDSSCQERC